MPSESSYYGKLQPVASRLRDETGDVLGQPTRARLFARLASGAAPAGTNQLAIELGLHPSGIRVHLDRLRTAGLILRHREPQPRGRPRDMWSVAPDARPGGEPPDAYRQLARWLAGSIPATPARLREVQRAGRELGRELASCPVPGSAEEAMGRALAALGFAPQRERGAKRRVVFRLGNCPYQQAARENQAVVCELHRGMTRGLLDRLEPSARLTGFNPQDPDRAGCTIEIVGLLP